MPGLQECDPLAGLVVRFRAVAVMRDLEGVLLAGVMTSVGVADLEDPVGVDHIGVPAGLARGEASHRGTGEIISGATGPAGGWGVGGRRGRSRRGRPRRPGDRRLIPAGGQGGAGQGQCGADGECAPPPWTGVDTGAGMGHDDLLRWQRHCRGCGAGYAVDALMSPPISAFDLVVLRSGWGAGRGCPWPGYAMSHHD